ncbi:MAG: hypothetical protein JO316_22925 [Abitibacteriaceae bacterium]|nr:hypothetical protein [Abditibacteriaceae bacterium]MBV9868218.1 hypothetical protein [Abditibacteriaceae bacterium]
MAEETSRPKQGTDPMAGVDLRWVWLEVRKRVFIKLPFSLGVADAMEAIVPITLDDDAFICGLAPRDYPLATHLVPDQVKNTIEGILRQAAGRFIRFEVIEGTTMDDWEEVKERRKRAQEAVIAMAEQQVSAHHFEDVLNQIISELRQRITVSKDRALPQVRAQLILDVVPSLADAEEMLFADPESHDARRSMSRVIDRIAGFLEITPIMLAIEVERHRRQMHAAGVTTAKNEATDKAIAQLVSSAAQAAKNDTPSTPGAVAQPASSDPNSSATTAPTPAAASS